jgi:hypothetical protein
MEKEFKDFRISEPNLHDGSLERLSIRGEDFEIDCTDAAGRKIDIRLFSVRHLKADNFRLGNIIFSVEVFTGKDCSDEILRQAAGLDPDEAGEWVIEELARIAEAGWTGVRITSSYGCELVAICESWRFDIQTQ